LVEAWSSLGCLGFGLPTRAVRCDTVLSAALWSPAGSLSFDALVLLAAAAPGLSLALWLNFAPTLGWGGVFCEV